MRTVFIFVTLFLTSHQLTANTAIVLFQPSISKTEREALRFLSEELFGDADPLIIDLNGIEMDKIGEGAYSGDFEIVRTFKRGFRQAMRTFTRDRQTALENKGPIKNLIIDHKESWVDLDLNDNFDYEDRRNTQLFKPLKPFLDEESITILDVSRTFTKGRDSLFVRDWSAVANSMSKTYTYARKTFGRPIRLYVLDSRSEFSFPHEYRKVSPAVRLVEGWRDIAAFRDQYLANVLTASGAALMAEGFAELNWLKLGLGAVAVVHGTFVCTQEGDYKILKSSQCMHALGETEGVDAVVHDFISMKEAFRRIKELNYKVD